MSPSAVALLLPVLAAFGLGAAGCSDSTAPPPLRGRYALQAVDGQPSPFVRYDHTFSTGERIVSQILGDTVAVLSDTVMQRTLVEVHTHYPSGTNSIPDIADTVRASTAGRYELDGARVIVRWPPWTLDNRAVVDTVLLGGRSLRRFEEIGMLCQFDPTCPGPGIRRVEFRYDR